MKLLKPSWVSHNGKPIFSVDIHPDGTKFATGGQGEDSGKVVIWNMAPVLREEDEKKENIPKMLCQMDNHLDVMDVAWSPHDVWLASCSVDNTIVIWNARKFPEIVASLKGHTGLVKGLTWDPVGKYIASQADDHSLKCGGTTHVLRLSWSPDGQYLKFNPKIFKKKQRNGSSPKPSCPYCCCALTSLKRPLVVIHDLFDKSIMDISWTLNGLGILVCSMDGTNAIHQNIYGKSLAITTEAQLSTTIIENPEMLKYQQERQRAEQANHRMAHEAQAHKLTSNLLKKQVETRTADGRRRITPLCIAQLDTGDFSPALFNSVPILPGSSSQLTSQLSSDSNTATSNLDPLSTPLGGKAPDDAKDGVSGAMAQASSLNTTAMKSNLLLTSSTKMEPMKALDSRFTERSKVMPGVTISSMAGLTPLDRVKDSSTLKDLKDETSSDSEDKMAVVKSLSFTKRKALDVDGGDNHVEKRKTLDMDGGDNQVEKRKKGRPRKMDTKMMTSVSHQPLQQVSLEPPVYLEVENEVSVVSGAKLSQLRCSMEGREWDTLLPSRVITAAGSSDVVAVACADRMLSVFSACGRRLLPSILLSAPMSALHCSGFYVMALTACATLSVWDVQKQSAVVKNESLQTILSGTECTVSQSLLTQQGVPVIGLSNGKSYCFNSSLETWNLIADKQDSLVQCADFKNCISSQDAPCGSPGLQTFVHPPPPAAWHDPGLPGEPAGVGPHPALQHRGLRKRDLLRELLPVIGQNLRFQRLFTEYQDQLELLGNK
ncbi:unnamed protein product [Coregonus sp. 'balchen']|nr:unnamed protein product [Coregonus sp. 'balchen']